MKCWGRGVWGNLGQGNTLTQGTSIAGLGDNLPTIDLGSGRSAVDICCGTTHVCAILDNDSIKCWGEGFYLGQGDTTYRGDNPGEMGDNLPAVDLGSERNASSISCLTQHTCAILDNGHLKCWGNNILGMLGIGNTQTVGDSSGEMGDNLTAVDLGTGRTAIKVAAGYGHTCAILDNYDLKCWGDNIWGELGYNHFDRIGNSPGEMGDNLAAIDLGSGRSALAVAACDRYTCVILDNYKLKCWGYNGRGNLGLGHDTSYVTNAGGGDSLAEVDLGVGRFAVDVKCSGSSYATCAILDNGDLKCWGGSVYGILGRADDEQNDIGDSSNEMGDDLPAVNLGTGLNAVSLQMGTSHACAVIDNGELKCWGSGSFWKLGNGNDQIDYGLATGTMGDSLPFVCLSDPCVTGSPITVSPTGTMHPATSTPTTSSPSTSVPSCSPSFTFSPSTYSPSTKSPSSPNPTTQNPATDSPSTDSPSTESPSSPNPTTQNPATDSPSTTTTTPTQNPTSNQPSSSSPTQTPSSARPSESPSRSPLTFVPSTSPLTSVPSTNDPTRSPTSSNPLTCVPTVESPTTNAPTTAYPASRSSHPTTAKPSITPTSNPTFPNTISPTTSIPTSAMPSTAVPIILTPTTNYPGPTSQIPSSSPATNHHVSQFPSSSPTELVVILQSSKGSSGESNDKTTGVMIGVMVGGVMTAVVVASCCYFRLTHTQQTGSETCVLFF